MIWIANHNVQGQSDNLRLPLSQTVDAVTTHANDPDGSPAIVNGPGPWTGINIDVAYDDIRQSFEDALGSQIVFADQVNSSDANYITMDDELNA